MTYSEHELEFTFAKKYRTCYRILLAQNLLGKAQSCPQIKAGTMGVVEEYSLDTIRVRLR